MFARFSIVNDTALSNYTVKKNILASFMENSPHLLILSNANKAIWQKKAKLSIG